MSADDKTSFVSVSRTGGAAHRYVTTMEASMTPLDLLSKIASEQIRITLQGGSQQQNSNDSPDTDAANDSKRSSDNCHKKSLYPKAATMEASMTPLDWLSKIASEQIRITLQEQQNSSDCPDTDAAKDSKMSSNHGHKISFHPKAASTPRSSLPILKVKQQSVTMTIPRARSTDSSDIENMPVKRQKLSRENGEGSSKTRDSKVGHPHCLTEEIRKCVSSTLKGVLAGCDEDKFESLIKEINTFILSLYEKGYFDIMKTENKTQETHNPSTPGTSKSSTSSSTFNTSKTSRKIVHKRSVKKRVLKEKNNASNELEGQSGRSSSELDDGSSGAAAPNFKNSEFSLRNLGFHTLWAQRRVLATHSLTGKASPAFPNKPAKEKLDPRLVQDIVQTVMDKCGVTESQVRTVITTKCADECKMSRARSLNNRNTERHKTCNNVTYESTSSE
ncbi:unnamed protein product [Chilo suppressalis]|uniref:BEN domain-containing protein n=1 Tax=Chilo suppressalis TaxID=168631 RepID=A0ABN8B016_CHISP|nr:unnamed protein product [Chilo suppressalis]